MNKHIIQSLERERSFLLNQWAKANENEKVKILVKIMDIDERLESKAELASTQKYVL
ncbi:MAG: hypothetical protein SCK28_07930 [Bacillota bacterium]|nr:hypothetical protein [Bacillota bacterium]